MAVLIKFTNHINRNKNNLPKPCLPAGLTAAWKYCLTQTDRIYYEKKLKLVGFLKDSKSHRRMMQSDNLNNPAQMSLQQLWAQIDMHHALNMGAGDTDPNEVVRREIVESLLEFCVTRDGVSMAKIVACLHYCKESTGMLLSH
jgi:hypothetical protein